MFPCTVIEAECALVVEVADQLNLSDVDGGVVCDSVCGVVDIILVYGIFVALYLYVEMQARHSYDYSEKLAKWVGERKHLQQNLTIMQLAKEIGTNQKYLSRYFNEVLDTTFRNWLNGLRIVDAKRMLADEDNKTTEAIAFECGFSSRTHFHSLFVKHFGKIPLQYKSECQRQKNNEGSGITHQQRLRE